MAYSSMRGGEFKCFPSQLLLWGHEVKGRGREKDHLTLLVGATLDGVWQTQGMYVRRAIFALSDIELVCRQKRSEKDFSWNNAVFVSSPQPHGNQQRGMNQPTNLPWDDPSPLSLLFPTSYHVIRFPLHSARDYSWLMLAHRVPAYHMPCIFP